MLLRLSFRLVRLCAAGFAGLLFMAFGSVATAQDYDYTARLSGPTAQTGAVVADGITWQCAGDACTARGPWPVPGIGSCAALAREVGRTVLSYGREGARLRAPGLAACNARGRSSIQRESMSNLPPVRTAPAPQNDIVSGVVNVAELFVVGGAYSIPPPDIAPQRVATAEMSLVGGTYTPPGADIAARTIATPEMSVVGASSN